MAVLVATSYLTGRRPANRLAGRLTNRRGLLAGWLARRPSRRAIAQVCFGRRQCCSSSRYLLFDARRSSNRIASAPRWAHVRVQRAAGRRASGRKEEESVAAAAAGRPNRECSRAIGFGTYLAALLACAGPASASGWLAGGRRTINCIPG